MTSLTRYRPRPATKLPPNTISLEFWMVREDDNYKFFRINRKPKQKTLTMFNFDKPETTYKTWGDAHTTQLCVSQIHRLFPGLGRLRFTDAPKKVRITMEVA